MAGGGISTEVSSEQRVECAPESREGKWDGVGHALRFGPHA